MMGKEILEGVLFWAMLLAGFFLLRPRAAIHRMSMESMDRRRRLELAGIMTALIALAVFVMTLSPMWNGTIMEHKGQYEMMTESILQGRLDLDIPLDPRLPEMENPYVSADRLALAIDCPLDHAYYQGHYYMYFGIVPVFLAFLPWRVLTGQQLLSVHATQWFTAVYLVGLTVYFLWLARKKFSRVTWGAFLMLLILSALLSTLFVAKFPSLYQTPVACGMMLEIWSLYCFSRAVWDAKTERNACWWAWAGAWLGALTFGCRPPLALANLLVIPLLLQFMKGKRFTWKRMGGLAWAASPYIVVAAALMWYNDARFGNPFEFGQAYQLTTADQSAYGHIQGLNDLARILIETWNAMFAVPELQSGFPFLSLGSGAFTCCPLVLCVFLCFRRRNRVQLRERGLSGFAAVLVASVILTLFFQVLWSPVVLERYKSDVLYLLCVGMFMGIGSWMETRPRPERDSWKICYAALACVLLVFLLFMIPDDYSYTAYYVGSPERIWNRITFGLL